MPVTAKLSREFYERLGDSVANELVEMLNTVDQNYRTELRELNDLNFARFDAKVEQRFAEFGATVDKRFAESAAAMDKRFAEFGATVDKRFAESAAATDKRFAEFSAYVDRRFAEVRAEMDKRFAETQNLIERTQSRLLMWSFSFWVTTLIALYAFTRPGR
jgi:DNA anti-recombination protein RmuC